MVFGVVARMHPRCEVTFIFLSNLWKLVTSTKGLSHLGTPPSGRVQTILGDASANSRIFGEVGRFLKGRVTATMILTHVTLIISRRLIVYRLEHGNYARSKVGEWPICFSVIGHDHECIFFFHRVVAGKGDFCVE